MLKTPKALRLQIGIIGRTNVGKSSLLNMITQQDVSIVSPTAGTTTDIVEKQMELLPIGPVNILDTGGIDDKSVLGEKRIERTLKILDRADIIILVIEPNTWTEYEENIVKEIKQHDIELIIVINKADLIEPSNEFINLLQNYSTEVIKVSAIDISNRDKYINLIKYSILNCLPSEFIKTMPLIGDLIKPNGLAILIVPIDKEAPKGRLILPQVQVIRDILDHNATAIVVKETEYQKTLELICKSQTPDIVVCDSQVVHKMIAETPENIKCTTFSILFARNKGNLEIESAGAVFIDKLEDNDKILIAEACSHHPIEDDIGRVKIPNWLRHFTGKNLIFETAAGRDFPQNLKEYKLIIHCGGCMLTRKEKLNRIQKAIQAGVPITNYGIAISYAKRVLERVLSPFPEALTAFQQSRENKFMYF